MAHVIQLALFAAALALSGHVLATAVTSPRCRAVLHQLVTGGRG